MGIAVWYIFIWPLSVIVYYNFTCHNEMNKNTENKTLIYYLSPLNVLIKKY